jgi:hypothetical protein
MYDVVNALITAISLVKFSIITILQNFIHLSTCAMRDAATGSFMPTTRQSANGISAEWV